jgi:hypothetical protein
MAVEQDGVPEAFARPHQRARHDVVIRGVNGGPLAPFVERQRTRQGRDPRRRDRPDESPAVGVARRRVLRHRPHADVVGIAVQVAHEPRGLGRHVDLGPVRLADAVEAIDEQVGVAAHIHLGIHRAFEPRRAHAGVRDTDDQW